jgi:hypothetical protein
MTPHRNAAATQEMSAAGGSAGAMSGPPQVKAAAGGSAGAMSGPPQLKADPLGEPQPKAR